MVLNAIFGSLALLSAFLLLWQWASGRAFPLHRRVSAHSFPPAVSLLKPLKGCDSATRECLQSWFAQDYTGRVQVLFAAANADDPVCSVVRDLQQQFPQVDSSLTVCSPLQGANAKVSKLIQLEPLAKHELLIISDADVRVPADFLTNFVEVVRGESGPGKAGQSSPAGSGKGCGLVCCFYQLAIPTTLPMRWEAVCINADFWSQVLQSKALKPLDFALGAVMGTRRTVLNEIGGFASLSDCLADDYQLGHRIAKREYSIELSTVVVDCLGGPMTWREAWKHQLRWARTIRVCQPAPYFFSILSNPTLWPLVWFAVHRELWVLGVATACWFVRIMAALNLQTLLTRSRQHSAYWWLVPVKDLLQTLLWLLAFLGNTIEWRGQRMRIQRDGTLLRNDRKRGASEALH